MSTLSILSYDYPPNDGGISRLVSAVVNELSRRDRQIEVLTLSADRRPGLARPQISTQEVPRSKLQRDIATFGYLRGLPSSIPVLSTVWSPEGALAYLACRTNSILMAHGNEVMPYPGGLRYFVKNWLRRKALSSARAVICNSRYTERLVQAISPEANTVVITPGVDATRFKPVEDELLAKQQFHLPTDRRIILSVSRMDAYKGHDLVLNALAQMPAERRETLHYVIAGRGPHLDSLKALAVSLGLSNSITWLGFVADENLPTLYGCADLFVLCTKEDPQARGVEGFGMVFLEAQATGVPVIGTTAGGIPDAVEEGEGGWLIEQGDVTALQLHLERLSMDVSSFKEQGLRGRQRALTKGSWEVYVSKLLNVVDVKDA
ncbi:glycosyltransferase family 4 protein [Methylobacter sp. sgz302048]|uniref:glycosyltransferase family 4 protein n=1 Tax=Methylobacter sp. sgz302048 TaxID=3455945 RepID=UPI003F9EFFCE